MNMLQAALAQAAKGFYVFPATTNGKKRPMIQAWEKNASNDVAQITAWWREHPRANVAVRCGRGSNIIVVDIDDIDAGADILDRLPPTFTIATPRPGLHFYFRMPESTDDDDVLTNTGKTKDGARNPLSNAGEVRGIGGYVLSEGSYNPEGVHYEVANDVEIAPIPEWLLERLRKYKRGAPKVVTQPMVALERYEPRDPYDNARRYIAKINGAISGSGGHNQTMIAARVAVTGFGLSRDQALSVMHEYNARCVPPWSEKELEHKVDSAIKTPDPKGNTPGHLLRRNSDRSWPERDPFDGAEIIIGEMAEITAPIPRPTLSQIPSDPDGAQWALLEQVRSLGGLCADFADWVMSSTDYRQPGLAVGAVLALGSALSARRWVYGRSTGTLYVCAVAPTAEGKGRPQGCVDQALRTIWPAVIGANDFSSTASTIKRIDAATGQGVGLALILDEYGPQLKSLLSSRPSTHQQATRALLLQMATIGTGTYTASTSLARGGQDLTITAPALTILGSSTPAALHDAIGQLSVEDGLIGRHVFCEALSTLPKRQWPGLNTFAIPDAVRAGIGEIRQGHETWHKSLPPIGTSDDGRPLLLYVPEEIEDGGGWAVLQNFAEACDERRRTKERGDVAPELLGRAAELASRVCVGLSVLASYHPARPLVTEDVARCAVAVEEASISVIARSLREHSAVSDWERHRKRVEAALRRWGEKNPEHPMQWTHLLQAVSGIPSKVVEEITLRLVEEGAAEVLRSPGVTKPLRFVRLL